MQRPQQADLRPSASSSSSKRRPSRPDPRRAPRAARSMASTGAMPDLVAGSEGGVDGDVAPVAGDELELVRNAPQTQWRERERSDRSPISARRVTIPSVKVRFAQSPLVALSSRCMCTRAPCAEGSAVRSSRGGTSARPVGPYWTSKPGPAASATASTSADLVAGRGWSRSKIAERCRPPLRVFVRDIGEEGGPFAVDEGVASLSADGEPARMPTSAAARAMAALLRQGSGQPPGAGLGGPRRADASRARAPRKPRGGEPRIDGGHRGEPGQPGL